MRFHKDGPKRFRYTRREMWHGEGGFTQIMGKDYGYPFSPRRCLRLDFGIHPTIKEGLDEMDAELQEAYDAIETEYAEMSVTLHDDYESMFDNFGYGDLDWDNIHVAPIDARPLATPARLSR